MSSTVQAVRGCGGVGPAEASLEGAAPSPWAPVRIVERHPTADFAAVQLLGGPVEHDRDQLAGASPER